MGSEVTPPVPLAEDMRWMRVALAAARRAEGRAAPNPPVGCAILSSSGTLVAVGSTAPGGRPHAETEALAMAGASAAGGTAYVTLEPCAHTGQTGPCAMALVEAGIARVVIALRDPDERVNGRGIEMLAEHGLSVQIGVEAEAARQVMGGFLSRLSTGCPLVTVKMASSLDGMIALGDGAKRWITGPLMRRYVHLLRSRSDGLLSAIGTVLADNPEFTCRLPGMEEDSPPRFILDATLRTSPDARLFEAAPEVGVTIFCREDCDPQKAVTLRNAGAEIQSVGLDGQGRLALREVMQAIAESGCGSLMVEGGGKLAASLLQEGLVDRILWTQSQHLIGGDGIPAIGDLGTTDLSDPAEFAVIDEGCLDTDRFILLERRAVIG